MRTALLLLSCAIGAGCAAGPDDDDVTDSERTEDAAPPPFVRVTDEAGLDVHVNGGRGAAVGDIDGDGWPDLALAGEEGVIGGGRDRLLLNTREGTFVDVTDAWMPAPGGDPNLTRSVGAVFADLDNDGDQDLLLARSGFNRALRNEGGSFSDQSSVSGLAGPPDQATTSFSLADFDGDGLLDVYAVNNQTLESEPGPAVPGIDRLYRNLGDLRFEDVSDLLPEDLRSGHGFSATWIDADDDRDLDLYVANDIGYLVPNQMYRNDGDDGGGWQFTPIGTACGCALTIDSMGIAVADYDRDGRLDLYLSNSLAVGGERLLRQSGPMEYVDVTALTGAVAATAESRTGWGVEFLDFDGDGWRDLVVSFGGKEESTPAPNRLLRNVQGRFEPVPDPGFRASADSRGLVTLDYDRDGCTDVLFMNEGAPPDLYRNRCEHENGWIGFELVGSTAPRDGSGALVKIELDGVTQILPVPAGTSSVHSGSDRAVVFGLGAGADQVDVLEVIWPDGRIQQSLAVAAGRYVEVQQTP